MSDETVLAGLMRRFLGDDWENHWSWYGHYAPPGEEPKEFTLIVDGRLTVTKDELDAVRRIGSA